MLNGSNIVATGFGINGTPTKVRSLSCNISRRAKQELLQTLCELPSNPNSIQRLVSSAILKGLGKTALAPHDLK